MVGELVAKHWGTPPNDEVFRSIGRAKYIHGMNHGDYCPHVCAPESTPCSCGNPTRFVTRGRSPHVDDLENSKIVYETGTTTGILYYEFTVCNY